VYVHDSVVDAVTAAHVAALSVLPVSSNSDDVPVDVTASENVTVMATVPAALYDPAAVDVVTALTVGAVVSMMIVCPVYSADPCKAGRVSVALFPAASAIVPVSALVDW
jgi:hypothetical protein